jgi:hypothetical protein
VLAYGSILAVAIGFFERLLLPLVVARLICLTDKTLETLILP